MADRPYIGMSLGGVDNIRMSDGDKDKTTADIIAKIEERYGGGGSLLRQLADMIPSVQADDSSLLSGVLSRLKRTGAAIPKAALETSANWLEKKPKIGEDTIAPLGLFSMGTGLASAGMRVPRDTYMANSLARQHPDAVTGGDMIRYKDYTMVKDGGPGTPVTQGEIGPARHGGGVVDKNPDPDIWTYGGASNTNTPLGVTELPSPLLQRFFRRGGYTEDELIGARLQAQHPDAIGGGDMVRQNIAGGPRIGVFGELGHTPMTRINGSMHRPGEEVTRAPSGLGRPSNDLLTDNARSSVPGTVVQGQQQEPGEEDIRRLLEQLMGGAP